MGQQPGNPIRGKRPAARSSLDRIQNDSNALFSNCLSAFQAFAGLGELSENMRILSLNAELAAGRASDRGNAVRALTQYTRELVNRLNVIEREMLSLKSGTYNHSASALRILHQLRILDKALTYLRKGQGQDSGSILEKTDLSRELRLTALLDNVRGMTESVEGLSHEASNISDVMSQAGSIATNIAIEASTAGVHEAEFDQVAKTMRDYVIQLRHMVDSAGSSIRDADLVGKSLQVKAQNDMNNAKAV